jgi:hypothetical protein
MTPHKGLFDGASRGGNDDDVEWAFNNFDRLKHTVEGVPPARLDIPLADLVNAATYRNKIGLGSQQTSLPKEAQAIGVQYRAKLRAAQRFNLSEKSVRLICNLSHEQERLAGWSFLARLPYDSLWVELDLHAKVDEFRKMKLLMHPAEGMELVSPRMGLLMFREEPGGTSPRWICHIFYQYGGDAIAPGALAYVFDPEGDGKFPVRGSSVWRAKTLSLRPEYPRAKLVFKGEDGGLSATVEVDPEIAACGILEPGTHEARTKTGFIINTQDEHAVRVPDWLTPRMAVIVDPWWEAFFKRPGGNPKKLTSMVMTQITEEAGTLRWIITMLAAINGLPKSIKPRHAREGKRSIGMYSVPYLAHHDLELTIPREESVVHARKLLDKEARQEALRRRWHMVRGHWRVVEFGKRSYICRHDPVMVEKGLGMCSKCQLLVRWIPAHERGDATLGVVDHGYNVVTERET